MQVMGSRAWRETLRNEKPDEATQSREDASPSLLNARREHKTSAGSLNPDAAGRFVSLRRPSFGA